MAESGSGSSSSKTSAERDGPLRGHLIAPCAASMKDSVRSVSLSKRSSHGRA